MTAGDPVKLMLSFSLPLVVGNVCQQLYTVTDTAIVGQGVGLEALAALGCVDWLGFLLFGTAQGFTQGFSIRMAQQYGAGNIKGLKKTVGVSALLALAVAVIATVVSLLALPLFLRILNVPDNLYDMANLYMTILYAGVIFALYNNYCASALRAVGNSRTPLVAMIVSSVTNIVLDSLAVFVLKWGIAGAAYATVFSQFVGGTICLVKMRRTPELCITKDQIVHDPSIEKHLLTLGAPVSIQNAIISLGGVLVLRVVNSFGTAFIAGYTAGGKLYGILEIAALSYSFAVTTYIGQNYGAGLKDRVQDGMKKAARMSLITAVIVGGVMLLFGRQFTAVFISAENTAMAKEAGDAAYFYIAVMAAFMPVLYLLYVYRSALQGVGKPVFGLVGAFLSMGARLVCAFIAGRVGNGLILFTAEPAAWTVGALVVFIAWRAFMKKYLAEDTRETA